jgi:hypothetical protein
MKQQQLRFTVLFVLGIVAALAACASGRGYDSNRGDGRSGRAVGNAFNLATLLSGRFQAEGPGNDATLAIGATETLTGQTFNLVSSARGRLGDRSISEQGVVHIENQGRGALVSYIPRFDATGSELSPDATRVTETELRSACTFTMVPWQDGYAGETSGTSTCVRALGGAPGTWRFEVQPGLIRVTRPGPQKGTSDVVVFRRTS